MMTPEEREREFVTFATEQLLEAIAQPIKGAMAEGRENVRRQARREALEEAAQYCDEHPQDAACEIAKHFRALKAIEHEKAKDSVTSS